MAEELVGLRQRKKQVKIDLQGSYLIIFLYFWLCLELLFISVYPIYLGNASEMR